MAAGHREARRASPALRQLSGCPYVEPAALQVCKTEAILQLLFPQFPHPGVFQEKFPLYVSGSFTLHLARESFQRTIWCPRELVSFLSMNPSFCCKFLN